MAQARPSPRTNCCGACRDEDTKTNTARHAILVIGEGHYPPVSPEPRAAVGHHHRVARIFKHLEVVKVVADRHDFLVVNPAALSPKLERAAFGTALVHDVED